jgi:hypothetical protein
MTGSKIKGTVTQTVVIGTPNYPSPLTVALTGVVHPTAYGTTGIYAPSGLASVTLVNRGEVAGADGGYGTRLAGGVGIDLQSNAVLKNSGMVAGGYASYGHGSYSGGNGVFLSAGGYVSNTGTIVGGAASYAQSFTQGTGGAGVDISQTGTLFNKGVIKGGFGGSSYNAGYGGNGVNLAVGTLINHGTITGGGGGDGDIFQHGSGAPGGSGVVIYGVATVLNSGLISGGNGGFGGNYYNNAYGGVGVDISAGGMLSNAGTIVGGNSTAGVLFSGDGLIKNSGVIAGGAPSYIYYEGGVPSAVGLDIISGSSVTIVNTGSISGVDLSGSNNLSNRGTIAGSSAGFNGYEGGALSGNTGLIAAGENNITVSAKGLIVGGNGGTAEHDFTSYGGNGGAGVILNGGTLSVSGTIAGGAAGVINGVTGIAGDAVEFGTISATLAITSKAVFVGDIVANSAVNDTLVLDAGGNGTVSGLGLSVTGFNTIQEAAKADWTLQGSITGTGAIDIGSGDKLTIDAPVSIPTIAFTGPADLTLGEPNAVTTIFSGFSTGDIIKLIGIEASSLTFNADTLTLLNASGATVDTLTFTGKYHKSDFALQPLGANTEIVFAGPDAPIAGPLQDFQSDGALLAVAPATYNTSLAYEENGSATTRADPVEMLYSWHAHVPSLG